MHPPDLCPGATEATADKPGKLHAYSAGSAKRGGPGASLSCGDSGDNATAVTSGLTGSNVGEASQRTVETTVDTAIRGTVTSCTSGITENVRSSVRGRNRFIAKWLTSGVSGNRPSTLQPTADQPLSLSPVRSQRVPALHCSRYAFHSREILRNRFEIGEESDDSKGGIGRQDLRNEDTRGPEANLRPNRTRRKRLVSWHEWYFGLPIKAFLGVIGENWVYCDEPAREELEPK